MYEAFKKTIKDEFEEFVTTRKLSKAAELSRSTGQSFIDDDWPQYFTGQLDAKLVLICLNPGGRDSEIRKEYESFDKYFEAHAHFGHKKDREGIEGNTSKQFDAKLVRFLRPFGAFDFVDGATEEAILTNLECVVDRKLQLELIPYWSREFSRKGFNKEILEPYMNRILDVIFASPRDYVIFCGRIFEDFFRLSGQTIIETPPFKLTKGNGSDSKNSARFSKLRLSHGGLEIVAGLAHSFAQRGIPMDDYGRQCKALYG